MAPYARIVTYPPLGKLTVIPYEQENVAITLVVEWNHSRPSYLFDVCVAYTQASTSGHQSQWPTIPLKHSPKATLNLIDAADCQRAVYSGRLSRHDFAINGNRSSHRQFTVKFRVDPHAAWQWVSVWDNIEPGQLVFQQSTATFEDETLLHKSIDLAEGWNVGAAETDGSDTLARLFVLESQSTIPAAEGSVFSTLPLAKIPASIRYFAIVRDEPYWIGPRQAKGPFFHLEEDAIVASVILDSGFILTFVVVGWFDDVYQVFRSSDGGRIVVAAQNDSHEERRYKVVLSIGLKFQDTMRAAMNQVRSIVASSAKMASFTRATDQVLESVDLVAAVKSNEEWMDSLSFCTWNALGQDLTQSKLLGALEQLQKNNINISTLLIDDNWQSLRSTNLDREAKDDARDGFANIEANTSVAPTGLKDLISHIRTKYPNIKDIGVWHTIMGYWNGISPYGSIANQYATQQVDAFLVGNKLAQITTIAPNDLRRFYDDFYSFLRNAGLTFVKTDGQHMLSMYQTSEARQQLVASYQSAWTCAHLKHFGGKAISCMAQTPQTLFHSLLQTSTPAVVHRNSDDFFPGIPASHAWHVWVNAHNAHFTSHLNATLDWDMFQTDHDYSAYHAAARCVSGGPVLITDTPGQHDVKLLEEMTAQTPGGSSIALRTSPGAANQVFDLYTEGSILKVKAGTKLGSALMAVFNIAEREVREMIHVDEFSLPEKHADEIVVRSHRTGEIFEPTSFIPVAKSTISDSDEADAEMDKIIYIRLDVRGWDVLTAQPVYRLESGTDSYSKICVLGLLGKMSGASAITTLSISGKDEKAHVRVGLKAIGKLGVWFDCAAYRGKVEALVQGCRVDSEYFKLMVLPQRQSGSGGDDIDRPTEGENPAAGKELNMPHIWEIDVEAFWKQRAMWDATCKEVFVELVVG